jgi:hypothetical protein
MSKMISVMQSLMSLIDKNAENMPEGDYLEMCRLMMDLNKRREMLVVTPDVVGEEFIMTADALNKCHRWITASEALREAFSEYKNDLGNKMKLGIYNQIREASRVYWRELTQTCGYDEIMWFIHRGTLAQRHFRYYGTEGPTDLP